MIISRIAALLLPVLILLVPLHALGASAPRLSRDKFSVAADAMKGSAALRRLGVERCAARMNAMPKSQRANIAALIDVSLEHMPATFCERVLSAMASGQMSYDDYVDAIRRHLTVKVVHIIQGR
ncbi:hypothetical protein SAMN05444161_7222 [Rhizobiales bacterium GAS191]|nr:hypothetical protein SAMN05444161_7222 [Rhizobiales bacterium GAS191]